MDAPQPDSALPADRVIDNETVARRVNEAIEDGHRVPVLSFMLPAAPRSVAQARHWMLAFAQEHSGDKDVHDRVALAFSEAFTNAVLHAYNGRDPRADDISVFADVDEETLEIVVADHGAGLRPDSSTRGVGAGLGLIAQSTDAFAIRERVPAGTEVWMSFALTPAR